MKWICVVLAFLILVSLFAENPSRALADPVDVPLYVGSGGGSLTWAATSNSATTLGDNSANSDLGWLQRFLITSTSGTLSQFQVTFASSTGSPGSSISWSMYGDAQGVVGSLLQSGTFSAVIGLNSVPITSGITLSGNTVYYLYLALTTNPGSANNFYSLSVNTLNQYANGYAAETTSTTPLASGFSVLPTWDLLGSITTVASGAATNTSLSNAFVVGVPTKITDVQLYLKKFGLPSGTLTAKIVFDNARVPTNILIDPNAIATLSESGLTTSYAWSTLTFAQPILLTPGLIYDVVLTTSRTDGSKWIDWGMNSVCGFASGGMRALDSSSVWEDQASPGMFAFDFSQILTTPTPTSTITPTPTITPGGPTLTPTPTTTLTPVDYATVQLAGNNFGTVHYTATAGEIFSGFTQLVLIGLFIGVILILLIWRRRK